jgi:hypothetical protein
MARKNRPTAPVADTNAAEQSAEQSELKAPEAAPIVAPAEQPAPEPTPEPTPAPEPTAPAAAAAPVAVNTAEELYAFLNAFEDGDNHWTYGKADKDVITLFRKVNKVNTVSVRVTLDMVIGTASMPAWSVKWPNLNDTPWSELRKRVARAGGTLNGHSTYAPRAAKAPKDAKPSTDAAADLKSGLSAKERNADAAAAGAAAAPRIPAPEGQEEPKAHVVTRHTPRNTHAHAPALVAA